MGRAVQKYLLIHDNFIFRGFIFRQPEPSSNVSTIQEAIFESRRQKIIEVCKKYKMNTGKPSSEIFDTILCFSKYQVSIPIYSDLPNNCAANLNIFWKKFHLHILIKTYMFINFWDFSFKTSLHALISLYSYMIIRSYTIIWQVKCIAYLYTGVFFVWKPFLFMFLVLLLSKFQNWNNYLDASFYGINNISAIFQ